MARARYTPETVPFARRLRREATVPERLLWSRLPRRQLGVRVLRQRPIGRYVADVVAEAAALVIEVDGWSHDGRGAYDRRCEEDLRALGRLVL